MAAKPSSMSQLRSWDAVLPDGFVHQSVHELLVDQNAGLSAGASPAALLTVGLMGWGQASAACSATCSDAPSAMAHRRVAWIDSASTFYPPAAIAAGIPAERLYVGSSEIGRCALGGDGMPAVPGHWRGDRGVAGRDDPRAGAPVATGRRARRRDWAAAAHAIAATARQYLRRRHALAGVADSGRPHGAAMEHSTHSRPRRAFGAIFYSGGPPWTCR